MSSKIKGMPSIVQNPTRNISEKELHEWCLKINELIFQLSSVWNADMCKEINSLRRRAVKFIEHKKIRKWEVGDKVAFNLNRSWIKWKHGWIEFVGDNHKFYIVKTPLSSAEVKPEDIRERRK